MLNANLVIVSERRKFQSLDCLNFEISHLVDSQLASSQPVIQPGMGVMGRGPLLFFVFLSMCIVNYSSY